MKVALCLMTWNEKPGCEADLPKLPLSEFDDVYALDGGSKDGTIEFLEQKGIKVIQQKKRGLNNAYIEAVNAANADAVVIFFPKGTTPPEHVLDLKKALLSGYDFVVASRNMPGGVNEEDKEFIKPRKWFVMLLALLASVLWRREGQKITDVLHGVKGVTKSAFQKMQIAPAGQSIDLEMTIRSYKLGIKRTEIPTQESARFYGETHFKALPAGWKLLKFLFSEVFNAPKLEIYENRK